MNRRAHAGGFTVLEAVVAMAILLIGAAGLASLQAMGSRMNGDARVMTRAVAVGQDLVNQIQTWDYLTESPPGGRLANSNSGNDEDVTDTAAAFEGEVSAALYDHSEEELEAGAAWSGIPSAEVDGLGFERYWNVAPYPDPDTGAVLGLKVAVIVRWDRGGAPRRIVLTTFVRDPGVTLN